MSITYIRVFYIKGDLEIPIGLGHFDSEKGTHSLQLLTPKEDWDQELNDVIQKSHQLYEWMHTETIPYYLDHLSPNNALFWFEASKLLDKTNIRLRFCSL